MNLLQISWKNTISKPGSTALNLILFAFGVSIISLMIIFNRQLEDTLEKNQAGIGLVVGAKGSPLQLILSSIYHIDVPTGNIKLSEANRLKKHPLVAQTIPLALGDSYKGFRIVGTNHDYTALYKGEVAEGVLWNKNLEVTLGAKAAQQLNMKVGDTFFGAHGMGKGGESHDNHAFTVSGILHPSGSVIDQLIMTNIASVWQVHEHGEKSGYQIPLDKSEQKDSQEADKEITSMLIKFRNPMGAITLPRMINSKTNMQAASPAFETARLFSLVGVGIEALQVLAAIIIGISGLSVFISLYNSLKERRYEIAYLRVLGATRFNLFVLIVFEGLIIAFLGFVLGIGLSHSGMGVLSHYLEDAWKFTFSGWELQPEEVYLFWGALLIGVVSAVIPAWQASRTDISPTLATR